MGRLWLPTLLGAHVVSVCISAFYRPFGCFFVLGVWCVAAGARSAARRTVRENRDGYP